MTIVRHRARGPPARPARTRADDVAPPPHDLAGRTRERHRAQRRGRMRLAAGGLVAALVVVGVPVVGVDDRWRLRARHRGTRRRAAPGPAPSLDDLPTRGSLADDEDWVEAVRRSTWAVDPAALRRPASPTRRSTRRTVAFAGDVPGGRVALVLGADGRARLHAWFIGPVGATPDQMALADLPRTRSAGCRWRCCDAPDPASDSGPLVVVAGPATRRAW